MDNCALRAFCLVSDILRIRDSTQGEQKIRINKGTRFPFLICLQISLSCF